MLRYVPFLPPLGNPESAPPNSLKAVPKRVSKRSGAAYRADTLLESIQI